MARPSIGRRLGEHVIRHAPARQGRLFGWPGHYRPSHEYCFDTTTDEARALVGALDDAGIERRGAFRLSYRLEGDGPTPDEAFVYFEPYLPHGEIICSPCG